MVINGSVMIYMFCQKQMFYTGSQRLLKAAVEELQLYLRCRKCKKEKTIKFVNSGIELIPKENNE